MLVWFLTLAITGIIQIARHPSVFAAINPLHALWFVTSHGSGPFIILGSIFLVVTGAEALYADLGHFGPKTNCSRVVRDCVSLASSKLFWTGSTGPA
jgi:KUP system potassium uptake protein